MDSVRIKHVGLLLLVTLTLLARSVYLLKKEKKGARRGWRGGERVPAVVR